MITVHKNFFDESDIEFLEQECNKSILSSMLRTSYTWHPKIVQESSPVLIYDIPDANILTKKFKEIATFKTIHYMIYHWPNGSYIPWHTDEMTPISKTGTLYLNRKWKRDWGGAFLFEEGDNILAEFPEYNKLIIQTDHTPHATTPVTKPLFQAIDWDNGYMQPGEIPPVCRITLQVFMDHGKEKY